MKDVGKVFRVPPEGLELGVAGGMCAKASEEHKVRTCQGQKECDLDSRSYHETTEVLEQIH